MHYALVPIIALVILVIINLDIFLDKNFPVKNIKAFRAYRLLVIAISLFFICDFLWGIFDSTANTVLATIDTGFYFVFMSVVLFAWTYFVMNFISLAKGFNIFMRVLGFLFLLGGISLVIANIYTPILFSYGSSSYAPKVARDAFLITQISFFIVIAIYAIVARNFEKETGYRKGRYTALAISSLVFAVGVVLQLFFPNYPLYTIAVSTAVLIIYTFIVVQQKASFRRELSESYSRESTQLKEIKTAKKLAYIDPLTGVKNKHAFVELENQFDEMIHDKKIDEFSLLVFDLNNLKYINDTQGHEMGDQFIKRSVQLIKQFFPGSEIYRYGGDEFVIIIRGEQYQNRYNQIGAFNALIDEHNADPNSVDVIAAGISDFIPGKDNTLRSVFLRADDKMYARKSRLKNAEYLKNENVGNKITGTSLVNLRYQMYEMFYYSSDISLLDMLNSSNCDEVVEFDISNDSFKQIYHIEGKYFVPNVGNSYKELLEFTAKYVVHPDDIGAYLGLMQIDGFFERLKNARIPNFDFAHFRYKLLDGTYRWVEQVVITGEEYNLPDGMFRMYVFDIENIKSRQLGKLSEEGSVSFGRDLSTGLYASKEFLIKANEIISNNKETKWCLIALDIEHFKMFDEWFGREEGNRLLKNIGEVLKDFEKEHNCLAGYFGQDDFGVLCEYNMDDIQALYNDIHNLINSFGFSAGFLPAFGVAVIEKDMIIVDALDKATIAASRAKGDIRNKIVVYDFKTQFRSERELRTLTDFFHGLQNNEITFHVQPQVRIPSGQIICGEALVRWIKDDGTIISPGVFIPILEKYGFITDLDKRVWTMVAEWLSEEIKKGHRVLPISVNVSRIDIVNIDVASFFHSLCEKYELPHNLIKLEITESAYAENVNIADALVKKLRADGFMVLMDDFGSGYSSLNMLSTLRIDAIKIDAKFLQFGGADYRKGINIIESVVNMSKTMALPVIMEGVEKKNQVDFLVGLGVDFVQGYYFYKAVSKEEFEKLISDKKNVDEKGFSIKSNEQFRVREFLDKNIYSDSMLNNIIGSVAIYSWNKTHIDIVRYNQQFYDAVDVPDFVDRLVSIEQFMPKEDYPKIIEAFKSAKTNRLNGASAILRFYKTNGVLSSFDIHFYYIGKKEGTDRFYGSAVNVTRLFDFMEGKELVSKFSEDNLIFIGKVDNVWRYTVVSHALSNLIGLSPKELEEELNDGKFFQRISNKKAVKSFMIATEKADKEKQKTFEMETTITNVHHKKIKVHMTIEYVGDQANNFSYILRTKQVEE